MYRHMAYSRSKGDVLEVQKGGGDRHVKVLDYTSWSDALGAFESPSLAELQKFRVVVSTLTSAGKLHNMGLKRGHFDLILIDESGQARPEPPAARAWPPRARRARVCGTPPQVHVCDRHVRRRRVASTAV